jgi:hypothetical protein
MVTKTTVAVAKCTLQPVLRIEGDETRAHLPRPLPMVAGAKARRMQRR